MKNLIKLSRELVENLLNGNKQKLGKEYFFMFSISKFVLLKERILKKDSTNNILYFNNVENAKYIPAILSFADEIKKNGNYQINNTSIRLEKTDRDSQKLAEALWIFNKVRDSLAHGQYTIDLENDSILINNDHSNDRNNAYKLVCSISIKLLNSISFYIEEINKEQKSKLIMKYIDSIEIERVKDEIVIKKININKKEIMNIGYMFRNDCFDMAININDRDIILSNEKTKDDIDKYINSLSKFYNISPITIEKDKLNLGELDNNNNILQIIPNKKNHKFDKDKYTLLLING